MKKNNNIQSESDDKSGEFERERRKKNWKARQLSCLPVFLPSFSFNVDLMEKIKTIQSCICNEMIFTENFAVLV